MVPSSFSRFMMVLLSEGWDICRLCAAFVILSICATVQKYRSCKSSIVFLHRGWREIIQAIIFIVNILNIRPDGAKVNKRLSPENQQRIRVGTDVSKTANDLYRFQGMYSITKNVLDAVLPFVYNTSQDMNGLFSSGHDNIFEEVMD